MTSIAIIIPVFNNQATLTELCARLRSSLSQITSDFYVVLVDDGSFDNSWDLIYKECEIDAKFTGIKLSKNFGQHAALEAGLKYANADIIGIMDADLQEKPEYLDAMIQSIVKDKFEIVIGATSQKIRFSSRLFHALNGRKSRSRLLPITQRVFIRKIHKSLLDLKSSNITYGPVLDDLGFRKKYLEVEKDKKRLDGPSSYKFKARIKLAFDSLSLKILDKVNKVMILTFMVAALFTLYALITAIGRLFFDLKLAPGFNLVQITILIGFSVTLFMLCSVGLLLVKIENEFSHSPRYHISEIKNSNA